MITYLKIDEGKDFYAIDTDTVFIRDHKDWMIKHPTGPVTFDAYCKECGKIIGEDITLNFVDGHKNIHAEERTKKLKEWGIL